MHKLALAAVFAALIVAAPTPALADGGSPHAALIESKAGAVVSIKFTLNVNINFQGQVMNREVNQDTVGIIVEPSGLVMVPGQAFDVQLGLPPGIDATSTPTNIRVTFPGDDKEYPAILGAKDSKLGLAFALIKDLEGKKPSSIDMSNTAEPKIGDTLYGVSRLGQGFDHAPICSEVKVIGQVTKPRTMWALGGDTQFIAEPLYTAGGAITGICITESGVGGEGPESVFLLPISVAGPTVTRAMREARRALDEVLEAEEEAAAEAAADAADAAGGGDSKDGEGDDKGTPEKPDDGGDG
jgi:hypothetical protein